MNLVIAGKGEELNKRTGNFDEAIDIALMSEGKPNTFPMEKAFAFRDWLPFQDVTF